MKQAVMNHPSIHQPMYPGAADERYFAGKALEILAAILTGTGAISLMMLLVMMA